MPDKNLLLADLEQSYAAARRLSARSLAGQIERIGFQCLGCGQCCRGDDNSVVVFPFEVRRIMAKRELDWLEVAQPPEEGEWDNNGNFHTLEWRLKKRDCAAGFMMRGNALSMASAPFSAAPIHSTWWRASYAARNAPAWG